MPEVPALDQVDGKLDVHRRFEGIAGELAIPLGGVAIADEEQRTWMVYRQVNRRSLDQFVVVHVAAETSGIGGANGPLLSRRDSNAAEHRPQGDREILQRVGWLLQPCDSSGGIDRPAAVERVRPDR